MAHKELLRSVLGKIGGSVLFGGAENRLEPMGYSGCSAPVRTPVR